MLHLAECLGAAAPACLHATEIDEGCRRILLAHRNPPQHLFSDVCDRFSKTAIQKMKLVQARFLEDLEKQRDALVLAKRSRMHLRLR